MTIDFMDRVAYWLFAKAARPVVWWQECTPDGLIRILTFPLMAIWLAPLLLLGFVPFILSLIVELCNER